MWPTEQFEFETPALSPLLLHALRTGFSIPTPVLLLKD